LTKKKNKLYFTFSFLFSIIV